MNKIEIIRVLRKNTYVYVKRVYSTRNHHNYCEWNYDDYKEYRMTSDAINRIWSPKKLADWYYLMTGVQLIPTGNPSRNEMKYIIANRHNTMSYGKW